jgi:hypothetical protein
MFQFDPFGDQQNTSQPENIPPADNDTMDADSLRQTISEDLTNMIIEEVTSMGQEMADELNNSMGFLLSATGLGKLVVTIDPTVSVTFE